VRQQCARSDLVQRGYLPFQWVQVPSTEEIQSCSHVQQRGGRSTKSLEEKPPEGRRYRSDPYRGRVEQLGRPSQMREPGSPERRAPRETNCS
jgi:hypothetical protein